MAPNEEQYVVTELLLGYLLYITLNFAREVNLTMSNTIWKYCAIRAQIDGSVKKLKFFDADGNHTVSDISDPHLEIAKLGNDGWEMVTLTEITSPNSRVYYFKKQDE